MLRRVRVASLSAAMDAVATPDWSSEVSPNISPGLRYPTTTACVGSGLRVGLGVETNLNRNPNPNANPNPDPNPNPNPKPSPKPSLWLVGELQLDAQRATHDLGEGEGEGEG